MASCHLLPIDAEYPFVSDQSITKRTYITCSYIHVIDSVEIIVVSLELSIMGKNYQGSG